MLATTPPSSTKRAVGGALRPVYPAYVDALNVDRHDSSMLVRGDGEGHVDVFPRRASIFATAAGILTFGSNTP